MSDIPNYLKMFPEANEVFADRIEEHSKLLFPLFTIELNQINPEWKGQVHMLQFNEDPYNTKTAKYFNEYCKDCMIGFDVIDGKYSFKTDFRYFDLSPDWKEWFEKTRTSYSHIKQKYKETGKLTNSYNEPKDIFEQIGGEVVWTQGDETPIDPDGNKMTFIAKVYTLNYTDDFCDKDIYLFYSEKFKIAVLIYQTT